MRLKHAQVTVFFTLLFSTLLTIFTLWGLFIAIHHAGFPFPDIKLERFFDLAFFSISIFGMVIFLTMISFQTVEGRLSPGFLLRIMSTPAAHMGIYVLFISAVFCFLIPTLEKVPFAQTHLNELFMALITSIVLSILIIRSWVLRTLHQPYVVYHHLEALKWEEPIEDAWLELFECTFKAIKQGRINDALNFIGLMSTVFKECSKEKTQILHEDLLNLHAAAQESRPIARLMERKWPFLLSQKIQTPALEVSPVNNET